MANKRGKYRSSDRFSFGGDSKITVDGDYSHEIRRHLILERKLCHSVLKSRDITLSTKFCRVKAIVFPEVKVGP